MAGFTTKTFKVHDDYMTPKSAWEAVQQYIPNGKVLWEAFYGNGDSGRYLRELGYQVIHEEIDFFKENRGDIVVSNPPFSLKKEIIERLVALEKPFMLIMPSSTLNCSYIRDNLKDNIQLIVPRRRIQFSKLENGELINTNKCNFDCFYYCYKMDLPRDIIFLD